MKRRAVIAGAALTAASLVWFGNAHDPGKGKYVEPHVEDGKVVPGQFK